MVEQWIQDWGAVGNGGFPVHTLHMSQADKNKGVGDDNESLMSGQECFRHTLLLHAECVRLEALQGAHRELIHTDELLTKHIHEMEDFEARSKADRTKLLKGNSAGERVEDICIYVYLS